MVVLQLQLQFLQLQLPLQTGGRVSCIPTAQSLRSSNLVTTFPSSPSPTRSSLAPPASVLGVLAAAAVVLSSPPPSEETLANIPMELSSGDQESSTTTKGRIQRPKSRNAEKCTTKCVGTCIRGGDGAPGEGPLNVRRPIIVFKQGFRSRQYCLVECSDICNLLDDADKRR